MTRRAAALLLAFLAVAVGVLILWTRAGSELPGRRRGPLFLRI